MASPKCVFLAMDINNIEYVGKPFYDCHFSERSSRTLRKTPERRRKGYF